MDHDWEQRRKFGLEHHTLEAHERVIKNGPEYPGRDKILAGIVERKREIEAHPDYC